MMPKLIRAQTDPYWNSHVKTNLVKTCSDKTIFHGPGWGEFAAQGVYRITVIRNQGIVALSAIS